MGIYFRTKDIIHRISVKFVKAFLPMAKKPFYLRAVHMPLLDINGIAGKAEVYNVPVSAKVIAEGLSAGLEIINYLVADGYQIKTPLFELGIRIPGEYNGSETCLHEGKFPVPRIRITREFRKYIKDNVRIEFDGRVDTEGFIAEIKDEATGLINQFMTKGNVLTIQGSGLKIETDPEHEDKTGLFFVPHSGKIIKSQVIPVNEPKTLKVIVPPEIKSGMVYTINIYTMASAVGSGIRLKQIRSITSGCSLTA